MSVAAEGAGWTKANTSSSKSWTTDGVKRIKKEFKEAFLRTGMAVISMQVHNLL